MIYYPASTTSFVQCSGLHQPPRRIGLVRTYERAAGDFGASGAGVIKV